uniref:Uncharacterized protein n=1 Tax=Anguilla anguilla TaxID=7936 RepID=A0A0E9SK49_ANGAN
MKERTVRKERALTSASYR